MISAKVSGYVVDMTDAIDEANAIAVSKACVRAASQMKALCPVDKGRLRNSVQWQTSRAGNGGLNDSGGEKETAKLNEAPSEESGYFGATAYYAVYVNNGTRKQAAQPFAEPTVDIVFKGKGINDLVKDYGTNLEKMARRGKRRIG